MASSIIKIIIFTVVIVGTTLTKPELSNDLSTDNRPGKSGNKTIAENKGEGGLMNFYLNGNKYDNLTYREEFCRTVNWSIEYGCNIKELLSSLLKNYDQRLRPFMEDKSSVIVTVGFWILSIDSINVIDMDYQIDFFFRQSWYDPRLKHSYNGMLTVSNQVLEKIWQPDTYFENSKGSSFHDVTVPNKMLRIHKDGKIEYNARISVRASCPMDLRMFPMDSQSCYLNIESYGYSDRDIVFQWENKPSKIAIGQKVRTLPQYNLTGFETLTRHTQYVVGNWSGLTAVFKLERRTGYFFLHLYSPCALIVMISWISFCIPKESTAARVALGITSVLTITTILNMLNTSMPKVSYIKAVDWYLIVSFLFVFAVLIEYTLVLWLTDKERQQRRKRKRNVKKDETENHHSKENGARKPLVNGEYHELRERLPNILGKHFQLSHEDNHNSNGKPVVVVFDGHKFSTKSNEEEGQKSGPLLLSIGKSSWKFRVDTIDEYSRLIFPIAFATFNIVYWVMFLAMKKNGKS
eukprot:gene3629-4143_t